MYMYIYIYMLSPQKIYLFACWMKQTWWMKRTCRHCPAWRRQCKCLYWRWLRKTAMVRQSRAAHFPQGQSRLEHLSNDVLHVGRQKLPGACPQIFTAMPVLILRRSDMSTEEGATHLGRSLMNLQARWMICVPALSRIVFPLGSLWVLSLAKLGDLQTHLPFTLAGFFWCTTLSCSTPRTLAL